MSILKFRDKIGGASGQKAAGATGDSSGRARGERLVQKGVEGGLGGGQRGGLLGGDGAHGFGFGGELVLEIEWWQWNFQFLDHAEI